MVCSARPSSYTIMKGLGKVVFDLIQARNGHGTEQVVFAKYKNEKKGELQGIRTKMAGYSNTSTITFH